MSLSSLLKCGERTTGCTWVGRKTPASTGATWAGFGATRCFGRFLLSNPWAAVAGREDAHDPVVGESAGGRPSLLFAGRPRSALWWAFREVQVFFPEVGALASLVASRAADASSAGSPLGGNANW